MSVLPISCPFPSLFCHFLSLHTNSSANQKPQPYKFNSLKSLTSIAPIDFERHDSHSTIHTAAAAAFYLFSFCTGLPWFRHGKENIWLYFGKWARIYTFQWVLWWSCSELIWQPHESWKIPHYWFCISNIHLHVILYAANSYTDGKQHTAEMPIVW